MKDLFCSLYSVHLCERIFLSLSLFPYWQHHTYTIYYTALLRHWGETRPHAFTAVSLDHTHTHTHAHARAALFSPQSTGGQMKRKDKRIGIQSGTVRRAEASLSSVSDLHFYCLINQPINRSLSRFITSICPNVARLRAHILPSTVNTRSRKDHCRLVKLRRVTWEVLQG